MGDWTLDPGTEGYVCVRTTLQEDILVSAFSAIIPKGTHHTLLTVGDPTKPDPSVKDVFKTGFFVDDDPINTLSLADRSFMIKYAVKNHSALYYLPDAVVTYFEA